MVSIADKEKKEPVSSNARGTSGTEIHGGYFDEEYLSALLAEEGIIVFDKMRRSDGQVKLLLSLVKNPMKSASWTIEPVDEDDEEQEIADFVSHVLFDDMVTKNGKRKTFPEFLNEALTCVEFGFSTFEVVHKVVQGHEQWGDYLGISDLGFRHQRSILEWNLHSDGMINSVRQLVNGDLDADVLMDGQHLLTFSLEKEGDNYEGISMLRPCYGAWFRKNIYRKLQAIGIERAAKGVPIGIIPLEFNSKSPDYEDQVTNFQALIDKLSSNEKNGIVLGAGFDIKEFKASHDAEKVGKVIDGEDNEMASAFVANFIMLGRSGNSGSFALGTDLSSIFLSGIQNIGYSIAEKITLQVITPIVRAKYGNRQKYPKLTVSGIADKAGAVWAETMTKLLGAGAIQKSPALLRHVHLKLDLPEVDEELLEQEAAEAEDEPVPPNPAKPPKEDEPDKKKAFEMKAENLTPVPALIKKQSDSLAKLMRTNLKKRSSAMVSEMSAIIKKGGARKAVLAVKMPDQDKYFDLLTEWAGKAAQSAQKGVLKEQGKLSKKSVEDMNKIQKDSRDKLVTQLLLMAGYQDADIEKAVYFSFNESFGNLDDAATIAEIKTAVEREMDKAVIETGAAAASARVVNTVRRDVFLSPDILSDVESFVFANDDPQTALCKSMVGRVFSAAEYETTTNIPPLHFNCNSYIIAQTLGAAGNKPLTAGGLAITDPKLQRMNNL